MRRHWLAITVVATMAAALWALTSVGARAAKVCRNVGPTSVCADPTAGSASVHGSGSHNFRVTATMNPRAHEVTAEIWNNRRDTFVDAGQYGPPTGQDTIVGVDSYNDQTGHDPGLYVDQWSGSGCQDRIETQNQTKSMACPGGIAVPGLQGLP